MTYKNNSNLEQEYMETLYENGEEWVHLDDDDYDYLSFQLELE